MMDTSIHSVDLFRHLVGEVVGAACAVHTFHPAIQGLEDTSTLLLQAENGAVGVIEASWVTPHSANLIEVYGEGGAAVVDYNTGSNRFCLDGETTWTEVTVEKRDRFVVELTHFAAVVRGEAAPRVTGEDGLRAVEVLYQGYGNRIGNG
ncbi:MAG: hypothetical protein FJX77_14435 [Armatimonadetes bacterium]|nr:hypothetical protein [Armatimonadota bacterium]